MKLNKEKQKRDHRILKLKMEIYKAIDLIENEEEDLDYEEINLCLI